MLTDRDLERLRWENAIAALQQRAQLAEKTVAKLSAENAALKKALKSALEGEDDDA